MAEQRSKYDLSGLNPSLVNMFNELEQYLDSAELWSSDISFEENEPTLTVTLSTIGSAEETKEAASRLISFMEELSETNGFSLEHDESYVEDIKSEHFGEQYTEYSTYVEFDFRIGIN